MVDSMVATMDNLKENLCTCYWMALMWLVPEPDIHEAQLSPYMSLASKGFWKVKLKEYLRGVERVVLMEILKGTTMVRK
jgi:hypothetical protein